MLLSAIGKREVPIPEHIDIYHLTREMPPSDKTPLQCVMEVDTERAMLEREAERLAHEDGRAPDPGAWGGFPPGKGPGSLTGHAPSTAECEKLLELYERLEELDADKAEMRASRILHGLGFTPAMQRKKLKDFSGGWRMRVALARCVSPTTSLHGTLSPQGWVLSPAELFRTGVSGPSMPDTDSVEGRG